MPDTHVLVEHSSQGQLPVYDTIVIGAGISGLYMLYRLRELGMTARVFEAGTSVGGTWYWNRYPGARFDSESWTYGYSFSKELMAEWDWKEHFSPQPDTLEYLNYVADKFDLRRDMEFRSTVTAAHWDETAKRWQVTLESGRQASARFLFTAIGILSAHTLPAIPGRDSFAGPAYHPARWPHTPVDFTGKRVGIIGTGATAIQAIPEIAKQAAHLTVFQRRPNWAAPLHNSKISKEEMEEIKSRYEEIYAHCATTPSWFIHQADPRKTLDVSPEKREAFWEKLYGEPGFGIWMGNFRDILTNEGAPMPQSGRSCHPTVGGLPHGEHSVWAIAPFSNRWCHGFGATRPLIWRICHRGSGYGRLHSRAWAICIASDQRVTLASHARDGQLGRAPILRARFGSPQRGVQHCCNKVQRGAGSRRS